MFGNFDTERADGVYVSLSMTIEPDDCSDDPSERDEGITKGDDRWKAFRRGDWSYVGVRAKATIEVVKGGHGSTYHMYSTGLWGVESDSGDDYLAEIYKEQADELLADIKAIGEGPLTVDER